MDAQKVLQFWFEELQSEQWWAKNKKLDEMIAERFGEWHVAAIAGELSDWRTEPEGRLAEIIVLDQFSRNIYRGDPRSFMYDPVALVLAQEAIRSGDDQQVAFKRRPFFYMPLMHSESLKIHRHAVKLMSSPNLKDTMKYENQHLKIIEQFGRYPHRNIVLGRKSTPEEIEFLKKPGSFF